ncbi:723_t:CDS:2 [Cetraspora pellucida]|uniref:protein S-acyltransferase n=1 Tax=Cetraspora pellucida TaxID=1433469 RepID=A0A9N9CV54_9GLOM|nr:723_t:CDS:2 [Cetraspora pellucida]
MSSTGADFEPVKEVISENTNMSDITDITEVKQAVDSMTSKACDVDFSEMTIHQASRQGILHIVKTMIENGYAKATDRDTDNVTPLHFAVINNHVTVAKYLIDNGAEIDAYGGDLIATPLHWASRNGHLPSVTLLINHSANPCLRDSQGFDCLHLAVHSSNPMLVLYFICLDMAIDTQDSSQHTPLMWAAYQCDSLIVDILIRFGASLTKVNNTQLTPLHFAAMKSDKMCLRKLMEAGASINAKDENGKTPLDIVKEVKAIDKWNKAINETGLKNDGKRNPYLFEKKITLIILYLIPFVLLFIALQTLAHYPWFIGLPLVILEYIICHLIVTKVIIRAQLTIAFMRTPYLTSIFQASAFWVGATWIYKLFFDFEIFAPPYEPIASQPCLLSDSFCGYFQYDGWTAALCVWSALQLPWLITLLCFQTYQISSAKTTNEVMNLHRYSYFTNKSPNATNNATNNGCANMNNIVKKPDTAHQQECGEKCKCNRKHGHFSRICRVFEGHDNIVNPFDFGCWNNCLSFWSEGNFGKLQNVDWFEIFDTFFIESRGDLKSNGYTALKRDEEIV